MVAAPLKQEHGQYLDKFAAASRGISQGMARPASVAPQHV